MRGVSSIRRASAYKLKGDIYRANKKYEEATNKKQTAQQFILNPMFKISLTSI